MYESGWLSGVEEREAERERRREREGEIVLSYDERLDWLESDDCSKWPGRWLHLCFPFSPSLIPSSLTHLLSHLHLSHSLSHSRRASLCHPLFSLVSSWQPINTAPLSLSLSPNGTAISTNAFQTYSSCHIAIWMKGHVFLQSLQSLSFLHPILCLGPNVLRLMSTLPQIYDSGHQQQPLYVIWDVWLIITLLIYLQSSSPYIYIYIYIDR